MPETAGPKPFHMKKVCHVIPFYYPQYAAPYEYTQKLAQKGYHVDVIALKRPHEPKVVHQDNMSIVRVDVNLKQRFMGAGFAPLIAAARQRIKKQDYDLVHVYAFRGCGILPLMLRSAAKHWILDIRTGNVSHTDFWANIADKLTAIESKCYSAYIALDEYVGYKVLGKHAKFHVVSVGADLHKFQPIQKDNFRVQAGLPTAIPFVIYIGSLDVRRKPDILLEAFALAMRTCHSAKLLIVGDDGAIPRLSSLAKRLGIDEQVIFTGYVPYNEIPNYIACADIGLAYVPNTPEYFYQPPLKTAEYLACGLPTIATDTDGNKYFVQHEVNGLLVNDSVESVAAAIERLLTDAKLYARTKNEARSSVTQHDWDNIVSNRLIPFYESLLV